MSKVAREKIKGMPKVSSNSFRMQRGSYANEELTGLKLHRFSLGANNRQTSDIIRTYPK